MRKSSQILLLGTFILSTITIIGMLYLFKIIIIPTNIKDIALWVGFWFSWIILINEGFMWIKNGKRSDWSDIVLIIFLFITVYLFTHDILNSFIGAFSIYLFFGIVEIKDYEVLNKILLISLITYNLIFFAGIIDNILGKEGVIRDTAFSMSFWVMLILGFALFGRKYIVVWRFMSTQYLSLALYLISWLAVTSIDKFTPYNIQQYIYEILIVSNLVIYAFTGPLIDIMLGLKKVDNPQLQEIINEVAPKIGLNPKKIKLRYGEYPILNAMAYGAFWDMRMGIIAPSLDHIPKDELKGIVAHELAHLKGKHTLSLTLISSGELFVRKLLHWPATYYDYVFAPEDQPFSMFWFIVINLVVYAFLYIFVRMFEAQADLNTKRAGYGEELAKGLFNLESFYSYGREIGLNTMLLCDEKLTENNRMVDYLTTAQYLDKMTVNPSKGALLSNFLNSHPPSYHRIMASLHDKEISIVRESIMPLSFLSSKKARKFFLETEKARLRFNELATLKIKEEFKIDNIGDIMKKIAHNESYEDLIGKKYAFLNLQTGNRKAGTITGIKFQDNASEPILFCINPENIENNQNQLEINPMLNIKKQYAYEEVYRTRKHGLVQIKKIDLSKRYEKSKKSSKSNPNQMKELQNSTELNKKIGIFQMVNYSDNSSVEEPIFKYKLPRSFQSLKEIENKIIFQKKDGSYYPYLLKNVSLDRDFKAISLKIIPYILNNQNEIITGDDEVCTNSDFVFRFKNVLIPIRGVKDKQTWMVEQLNIRLFSQKRLKSELLLKKAVNNEEKGQIESFSIENNQISEVIIMNIFGEQKTINISKIDGLYLNKSTLIIENKKNISSSTKMVDTLIQRLKPENIFIV